MQKYSSLSGLSKAQITQILQMLHHACEQIAVAYVNAASQPIDVWQKADASPVTQVDLSMHTFICEHLAQITPEIPVLSEEGHHHLRSQWPICWLLDPLDGTKEFIHRSGEFTINLALVSHGDVDFSCIAVPMKQQGYMSYAGQVFHFILGQTPKQLTFNTQSFDAAHDVLRVAISRRANERDLAKYAAFFDYLSWKNIAYQTVEAGSAYKFCLMLSGEIDLYVRLHPTSEWDTAAGQGLLEACGGMLIDRQNRPFRYNIREHLENGMFAALRQRNLLDVIAPWWGQ